MATQQSPSVLYHYTTASGLLGILRSRRLWATHARFLNDAMEVNYGITLVKSILATYSFADEIAEAWPKAHKSQAAFFVGCFCEQGDLLSQWRGYTKSQTGYALGFESSSLSDLGLTPVIYDAEEQDQAVRAEIERWLPKARQPNRKDFVLHLVPKLLELAIRLKHPSFSEEREWRLIDHILDWRPGMGPNGLGLCFRASECFIIPYIELSPAVKEGLWAEPILWLDSVRFGPTATPEEVREALSWLLWTQGYVVGGDKVKVLGSSIPLRI